MSNRNLEEKMEKEPVPHIILSLAIPTVLSMLVISAYNIIDTFFVAGLGSKAAGAVGITFALTAWIQAAGYTIGMGAGSLISRLLGKKDAIQAEKIENDAIKLGLLLGLFSLGTGLLFLNPLLEVLGATESLFQDAKEYVVYILLAAPFTVETLVFSTILRAKGRARAAMAGIVSGGILDMIVTPLFLLKGNMGIKGAALAAGIGQAVAALLLYGCILYERKKQGKSAGKRKNAGKLSAKAKKITGMHLPDFSSYGAILKNGMPSFCRQGLASLAAVLLNRQAVTYGDTAVAAMSISGKIFMVLFSLFIGYGQGFQPAAGFLAGAGNKKKLEKAFHFTLWSSTIAAVLMGAAVFFMAADCIGFFLKDDRVIKIGTVAIRSQCVILPLIPAGILSNMLFQGIGQQKKAAFLSACRQGICFVPLILLLPEWIGLTGVEITQAVADGLTAGISIPFVIAYFRKKGQKKTSDGKRRL